MPSWGLARRHDASGRRAHGSARRCARKRECEPALRERGALGRGDSPALTDLSHHEDTIRGGSRRNSVRIHVCRTTNAISQLPPGRLLSTGVHPSGNRKTRQGPTDILTYSTCSPSMAQTNSSRRENKRKIAHMQAENSQAPGSVPGAAVPAQRPADLGAAVNPMTHHWFALTTAGDPRGAPTPELSQSPATTNRKAELQLE